MITSPCRLLSLPEEVLVEIICSCAVDDVVRLSMTCKHLQTICFLRPIWMALIRELDINQAPDISSHRLPDSFSTEELYRKAITAVRNSNVWRTPGALRFGQDMALRVDPRELIAPDLEESEPSERIDPRLLPGGRHALLENHGRLELWSLIPRARIWTAHPSREADCIAFDFEVVNAGNALMIAALFLNVETGCFVQVYRFEFATWENRRVAEYNLPMVFFFRLMIRGDLVMIHMPHSVQLTLLNWKTCSVLHLNFTNSEGRRTNARAALISDQHIIVVMHLGVLTLTAIPVESLSEYWSHGAHLDQGKNITFTHATREIPDPSPVPETDIDAPTRPNHALRLRLADPPRDEEEDPYILALHAFTPVWQHAAADGPSTLTEIYVVAYDNLQNRKKKSLLSYRAQLTHSIREGCSSGSAESSTAIREARNAEWRLQLIQETRAPARTLPWNSQSISNAGTMFSRSETFNCYTLFTTTPQPTNVLPIFPDIVPEGVDVDPLVVNVEPTSGALVLGTPGMLRVLRIV